MGEHRGRWFLIEIVGIDKSVTLEGILAISAYGRVVSLDKKPMVEFVDGVTGKRIDILRTPYTDATCHLLHRGQKVQLHGGGKAVITKEVRFTPKEIVFYCC